MKIQKSFATDDFIPIEKKEFECPNCHRPFYVAKLPDWMGDAFYRDMCEMKDKQLSEMLAHIRDLEEKLNGRIY